MDNSKHFQILLKNDIINFMQYAGGFLIYFDYKHLNKICTVLLLFISFYFIYSSAAHSNQLSSVKTEFDVVAAKVVDHKNFSRVTFDLNKEILYKVTKINDQEYRLYSSGLKHRYNNKTKPLYDIILQQALNSAHKNNIIATLYFEEPVSLIRHFSLVSPDRIIIDFSKLKEPSKTKVVKKSKPNLQQPNNKPTKNENSTFATNHADKKSLNAELTLRKSTSDNKTNIYTSKSETSFQIPNPYDTPNLLLNFPTAENFEKYRFQEFTTKQHSSYFTQTKDYSLKINQYEKTITNSNPDEHFGKWGFTNLQYTPKALNGLFIAEAEIAYNPNDIQDFPEITLGGFREYSNRMNQLKVYGNFKGFAYGTKYMIVNDGFDRVPGTNILSDQEGGEIWIEKKFNIFKLKTFYSNYWNNINERADRERKNITKTGITFDINSKKLPFISFTYSKGSMNTSLEPDGFNDKKEDIDSFKTYISYSKEKWGVSFSGDYSQNKSVYDPNSVAEYSYYYLAGNYRPNSKIVFSPSLSFSKEKYKWLGGGIEYLSPSASIWVQFKEFYRNLDLSGYLSYNKYISDDNFTNTNTVDSYATIGWNSKKSNPLLTRVSLKIAYLNYMDTAFSANSYHDYSILLNFRLASL